MTTIDQQIAQILQAKNAYFYHAINFADFCEYCTNGAILSRAKLSESFANYTRFFSDDTDKNQLKVWSRTFGNPNDFGRYFWSYELSTPNAYGPITIVLDSKCWDTFNEVKFTNKTITDENVRELSIDEIANMYEKSYKGKYQIKKGYTSAEVSVKNSCISLTTLAYILVEPFEIAGKLLREHVLDYLYENNLVGKIIKTPKQVCERTIFCAPQKERSQQLLSWSRKLAGKLIDANEPLENTLPAELKLWFNELEIWKKKLLASWLTYTFNGTLKWLDSAEN